MNIIDPKSLQDVSELVQENMAGAARAAEEFITDTVRRGTVTPDEAELAIAVHLAKNKTMEDCVMEWRKKLA